MNKLLGAAVLLLASVGYGFVRIREERRKYALLCKTVEFVRLIQENIEHFMKPLHEIYEICENTVPGDFLALCKKEGIRTAWEKAPLNLPGELCAVMESFCSRIGSGFREDALHLCDWTLEQLEKGAKEQKEELCNREKLYRTIPPLAALSLVLLLI